MAVEHFVAAVRGNKHHMRAARRQLKALLQDARWFPATPSFWLKEIHNNWVGNCFYTIVVELVCRPPRQSPNFAKQCVYLAGMKFSL